MREIDTQTAKYDFILDALGFENEPLEERAVVICGILDELGIPFKKYYTSPGHRHLRTKPCKDFTDMGMVLVGSCSEEYANYTIYLYKQKMEIISKLNNMMSAE